MIYKEKIDGSVKIESEKKTEKREEKKSDGEKIVGAVKFESKERSDGVVAKVQNVETEVAKAKEIKEKDCDGEKKEKDDGNNGSTIEKQVAIETKAEKEKEAIVSGSAIEVAQGTKPVEEKPLAELVEQVIKIVDEKHLPIETKTEKKEGGENGGSGSIKQVIKLVKGTIDIGCHYVKEKQVERNNCMGIQLHGLQRNKRWWHFHPVKGSILR